ncbi:unnamed protein product, partial [Cuscuta epithymum]
MRSKYGKRGLGDIKPTDSPTWRRISLISDLAEDMVVRDTNSIKWKHTKEGKFTTKSAYQALRPSGGRSLSSTHIWHPNQVPKVRLFLWRLWHKG